MSSNTAVAETRVEGEEESAAHAETEQSNAVPPQENPYVARGAGDKEDERRLMRERLELFREEMEREKATTFKFDMKAYGTFRQHDRIAKTDVGCHPRGVELGERFNYRAELAVCGIHNQLVGGIDYEEGSPCNAVVLSGKYQGDQDGGSAFTYSGQGGIQNETQVRDQEWIKGNKALQLSYDMNVPVKVVRCLHRGGGQSKEYAYDGLYRVTSAEREKHGKFMVCIFKFDGIPGQHHVSGQVEINELYPGRRQLATSRARPRKASGHEKVYGHASPSRDLIALEILRAKFLKKRSGVLSMDISGGKEAIRIPLINDTDVETLPPAFRYVRGLVHTTQAADKVINDAASIGAYTGCQKKKKSPNYDEGGFLIMTHPEGIKECPLSCACKNSIATIGIRYPLEVFRTEDKGWGVRCSVDIPSGAFICEYTGEVMTDEEAEQRIHLRDSSYLFSLDHFYLLQKSALLGEKTVDDAEMPKFPLSSEDIIQEKFHGQFLVIDAKNIGNVGRFLNHACDKCANVVAQMILFEGCSGVFHHVGFFALEQIPKYTELCHDYGRNKGIAKDVNCKGRGADCAERAGGNNEENDGV